MNITKTRIVADSSCDLTSLAGVDFISVPLTIRTDKKEYIDNSALDAEKMVKELHEYKGRSFSSCPNVYDWERAFEGADRIYVFTVTSALSGSYNSAMNARELCLEKTPEKKIHIFNTLSAGPEITLQIHKLRELILKDVDFELACNAIEGYASHTRLVFSLESLHNFAQNGRVSKVVAAACGVIGIRAVGQASDEGTLKVLNKARGEKNALIKVIDCLESLSYNGGKVIIGHSVNEKGAFRLRAMILEKYPYSDVAVHPLRGLCSYYADKGGILIGFEC